ncbi:hypothetical protein TCAL_16969 [Tigriopus californicus]|uniref:NR LBD domain-containing protein n=1 Tax=Tigriopus californicus TaxID=6832 RepID=A0A553PI48_TIGCA|nr:uncharacterized protein LOC131880936 [Tigriopus californicus]TRY77337.1 hypothetical protein TCAL_16969 [Tigriopus californicus]
MAPRLSEAFSGFSEEDEAMVRKLVDLDRNHSFHIGESLCDASLTAIRAYIDSAYSQTPLDFTAICWAYTKSIRKLTRFAQNIDDFNTLDVNDRKTLLLENLDPMFNIRVGHFFSCDATTLLDQLECLAVFDVSNLQSYIGGWIPQVKPLVWNQFFVTPWANSVQHERKFEGLMSDIKSLSLDKPTATILTVVSLLDTDGTTLKFPFQVTDIQKKYIGLLYRYLCHTRNRIWTEEKFPDFLNMLSNLKEMSDIMKNKTIKWSMAWPQIQNFIDLNEEEIDKNFFDPH